ncbi:taxon MazF [Neisseria meningitidis]|nr:taxon MazF [Neisseria meningitidis]
MLHFRRHFYSRLKSKIYTPVIPAQAGIRKVGLVGHEVVLKMKRYRKSDELKEKYSDIDETFEFIKGFIYVIALAFTAYVAIRFF